jgi:hypothetical protein
LFWNTGFPRHLQWFYSRFFSAADNCLTVTMASHTIRKFTDLKSSQQNRL